MCERHFSLSKQSDAWEGVVGMEHHTSPEEKRNVTQTPIAYPGVWLKNGT